MSKIWWSEKDVVTLQSDRKMIWQRKKEINNVKLSAFPEEVDKDGLKWYGEMFINSHLSH